MLTSSTRHPKALDTLINGTLVYGSLTAVLVGVYLGSVGFYVHASAYVLVNIGLFVINVLVGGGWWFYWPLLGWGIGLTAHAVGVFGFGGGGPWGREWEERKTREFMDQDRGR